MIGFLFLCVFSGCLFEKNLCRSDQLCSNGESSTSVAFTSRLPSAFIVDNLSRSYAVFLGSNRIIYFQTARADNIWLPHSESFD